MTELLGPFAVGKRIGGGGMASIYIGKYVAPPGEEVPAGQETVALKIIKGDFVKEPRYEEMFLDEAAILTQLSHPNVIRTVGYGAQAGVWFIAMELLSGHALSDVWEAAVSKKRRIPLDLAAFIAAEVARGLDYAHALNDEEDGKHLGLVHRDVNPTNIFVGDDGSVKLIDFGLAKVRKRQTQSVRGVIKGKVPYLSPEQIKEETLDGRSDVYALGATLWELCTMRRLFKRDTDVATIRAIYQGDVPDPRTFDKDFPEGLWLIIERALQRDRDKRYETAGAMANDLDEFLGLARIAELHGRIAHLVTDVLAEGDAAPPPEPAPPPKPAPKAAPEAVPPKPPDEPPEPARKQAGSATRDIVLFSVYGVLAGLAFVVLFWLAFSR